MLGASRDSATSTAHHLDLIRRHRALRLERLTALIEARTGMPPDPAVLAENRVAREAAIEEMLASGHSMPEFELVERFELSPFELDVLDLAVGVRLDLQLRRLIAASLGAPEPSAADLLTVGGLAMLLASSIEARIDLAQLLGRSRLFDVGLLRRPTREGIDAEVIATRRAVAAMIGRGPLDTLPSWVEWIAPPHEREFEIDPDLFAQGVGEGALVLVSGPCGVGKSTLARAVAARWNSRILRVNYASCAMLTPHGRAMAALIELVEDAGLLGVPVIIDDVGDLLLSLRQAEWIAEACERCSTRAVLCVDSVTNVATALVDRARLHASLQGVRGSVAAAIYRHHAGDESSGHLFEEVQLRPRVLRHAAELAKRLAISPELAIHAVGRDNSDLLETARVQLSLESLVVGQETLDELHELISAIKSRGAVLQDWGLGRRLSRGRGISALFDGEPGTGKTMAAEVVAHEVGLPLKKVNIAGLVDKYIGETEKNLHRVFSEARGAGYVLLFDEADALFGTRTDVKGSNDRYANLEINVLLQLMEEHGGVVLLTTNLRKNIDPAFLRRVNYKVQFDIPDEVLRERIWHELLPAMECDRSVDPKALARSFSLAGGHIKSAVLRACYRAASIPRKLTMADLVECAELECQALGRVVTYRSSL